jgi:hypothetical protein
MAEPEVIPVDANGEVVVPVVVPEVVKPPVYDEAQQKHFNDTINAAYGKAFDKASALFAPQIKDLNDKLTALTVKPVVVPVVEPIVPVVPKSVAESTEIARLNAQLAEVRTIADQLKTDKEEAEKKVTTASAQTKDSRIKEEFIRAADKVDFFDRMDVFNLVKDGFELDAATGDVVVIHPGTKLPRQNSNLKNMSLEEFIGDFAKTKPHMVRAPNVEGGSGATASRTLLTPKPDDVDYKTMPRDKFLALAQTVIDKAYS